MRPPRAPTRRLSHPPNWWPCARNLRHLELLTSLERAAQQTLASQKQVGLSEEPTLAPPPNLVFDGSSTAGLRISTNAPTQIMAWLAKDHEEELSVLNDYMSIRDPGILKTNSVFFEILPLLYTPIIALEFLREPAYSDL